jgi:hypothetical protein
MKFLCQCNHVIRDQTDDLPYQAWSCPDQSREAVLAAIQRLMDSPTPSDILQRDALMWPIVDPKGGRPMYQCPECGRIYIAGNNGELYCFKPEFGSTPKTLFQGSSSAEKAT